MLSNMDKALEEYFIIDFYLGYVVLTDTGTDIKVKIRIIKDEDYSINLHKRDLNLVEYFAEKVYNKNKHRDLLFVNVRIHKFKEYWNL